MQATRSKRKKGGRWQTWPFLTSLKQVYFARRWKRCFSTNDLFVVIGGFFPLCVTEKKWGGEGVRGFGEEFLHCCPQQPSLSSSALLMMPLAGTGLLKSQTQHRFPPSLKHSHSQTKIGIGTGTTKKRKKQSGEKTVPARSPLSEVYYFSTWLQRGLALSAELHKQSRGSRSPSPSSPPSIIPSPFHHFCFPPHVSPLIWAGETRQLPSTFFFSDLTEWRQTLGVIYRTSKCSLASPGKWGLEMNRGISIKGFCLCRFVSFASIYSLSIWCLTGVYHAALLLVEHSFIGVVFMLLRIFRTKS